MAFPVIVCWLEAAAVVVPLYHMLCAATAGAMAKAAAHVD